jgi:ERCC4-type nuclease
VESKPASSRPATVPVKTISMSKKDPSSGSISKLRLDRSNVKSIQVSSKLVSESTPEPIDVITHLPNTFMLQVDEKERDLQKELRTMKVSFSTAHMLVGNALLKNGEFVLLIWHLTLDALAQLMLQGRWKDLKRMFQATNSTFHVVLVSGNVNTYQGATSLTSLMATLWNTLLRDDLHLIQTEDINDSARWLAVLYYQWQKIPEVDMAKWKTASLWLHHQHHFLTTSTLQKKQNVNVQDAMRFMLAQLPSVSMSIATLIQNRWPSMRHLCQDFTRDRKATESELANLSMVISGHPRRLGKSRAKQIVAMICGC